MIHNKSQLSITENRKTMRGQQLRSVDVLRRFESGHDLLHRLFLGVLEIPSLGADVLLYQRICSSVRVEEDLSGTAQFRFRAALC